jgi:hypothetical protein
MEDAIAASSRRDEAEVARQRRVDEAAKPVALEGVEGEARGLRGGESVRIGAGSMSGGVTVTRSSEETDAALGTGPTFAVVGVTSTRYGVPLQQVAADVERRLEIAGRRS